MISEEYRQRFKEDLGNIHYAGKVQKILKERGFFPQPFGKRIKRPELFTIQKVMALHGPTGIIR